jgi:hypothetical protein
VKSTERERERERERVLKGAPCSTIEYIYYLGKSIVVSTGLHESAVAIELSRGTPGVGLNEKRPNGVGTQVEDSRVSCAVVCGALLS